MKEKDLWIAILKQSKKASLVDFSQRDVFHFIGIDHAKTVREVRLLADRGWIRIHQSTENPKQIPTKIVPIEITGLGDDMLKELSAGWFESFRENLKKRSVEKAVEILYGGIGLVAGGLIGKFVL